MESGNYNNAALITPSDTVDLTTPARGLMLITGATPGGLKFNTVGGQTITITAALPVGVVIIPITITRLFTTGTNLGTGGQALALY